MAFKDRDLDNQLVYYQRKYELNPRSRVFAPLADLLRKTGQVVEALGLLEKGLTDHPQYVSALVIMGRCHMDLGQQDEARVVFLRVLQLDPDNLVVLKLLAEDAARQSNWSEATGLLARVVTLDPSDVPAEEKLVQFRTQQDEITEDPSVSEQELDAEPAVETEDELESIADKEESTPVADSSASLSFEPDLEKPHLSEQISPDPEADESVAELSAEPEQSSIPAHKGWHDGLVGAGEDVIPLDELGEAIAEAEQMLAAEEGAEGIPEQPGEEGPGEDGEVTQETAVRQRLGSPLDADSLATKTLADIYLSQGYQDKALEVLRRILDRQPHREDIQDKIAEIEGVESPTISELPEPQDASLQETAQDHAEQVDEVSEAPEESSAAQGSAASVDSESTENDTTPASSPLAADLTTVPRRRYFENWIQKISRGPEE